MSLGFMLLIVVVLLFLGALPIWSHSSSWSYRPTGGMGLIVAVVVTLLIMGRI